VWPNLKPHQIANTPLEINMVEPKKILVDVISDVMCPWCYIGKKNLDAAVAELSDFNIEICWRPFQLDPTLPKEGKDRKQ